MSEQIIQFESTFEYKLIYIFRINDNAHKDILKIGDATINTTKKYSELIPNCHDLNVAAKSRIDQYTTTAGISYELLHTELAVRYITKNGITTLKAFRDHHVHDVLLRSGIERKEFAEAKGREWFKVDLETAKKAIQAVKENRKSLSPNDISKGMSPIIFRPEQEDAIKRTVKVFEKSNQMLWNAKMRFGKTLSALEVVKRCGFKSVLICTHRPVVLDGWFEDFDKIFYDTDYKFGSKSKGETLENLAEGAIPFVYFASMQDLRGSSEVGGKFDKNEYIFLVDWDCIIVDEAHEGTQTTLGKTVLDTVLSVNPKANTKLLELSGTPFNIVDNYESNEIYTWDYIMEQREKFNWAKNHFGDSNPYEELPQLQIYTYDLAKIIGGYEAVEDKAFNFKEFFRTWTGRVEKDFKKMPEGVNVGDFVHEDDVKKFLDMLCKKNDDNNFPYSTEEYRSYFRHTLWMLPGVKEAKALSALMKRHPVFGCGEFNIVNVAGDGDEEQAYSDALKAVRDAITDTPDEAYSITLSCGRLTTGVTIPEWTAVFMLSGSFNTSASSYMQTIFRVQSPANINGRIKERCCVFDFAPDRALNMVTQAGKFSLQAGNTAGDRVVFGEFLNFCPVISINGSRMIEYNVDNMLQQLKKAYTERVVNSGFDDKYIYNDNLLKLDDIDLKEFENLKGIIGSTKQTKGTDRININETGLTDEDYAELECIKKKPKRELTEEEKALLEERKKQREQAGKAMAILRGISIRIPLLIYGADIPVDKDITADNFPDLIDDVSWEEFMPKGITKDIYRKFAKYYEQDVFVAAGKKIRRMALAADELTPTERVIRLAEIFATFKNPDKETVLTPWRVVNMHMSDTLGGYDFYDENHEKPIDEPRLVDQGNVTHETLGNPNARILEINSKTGLYPLYVTYSIYRIKIDKIPEDKRTMELQIATWIDTVENNIFVVCKTDMARAITKRTLLGYREGKIHAHAFDDIIMQIKDKQSQLVTKLTRPSFWNIMEKDNMKFDAIVGNPPYQIQDNGKNEGKAVSRTSAVSIYQNFVTLSKMITQNYISLIIPSRWMTGGRGLDDFRRENIEDKSYMIIHDFENDQEIFPNTDIGGGVMYFLWSKLYNGKLDYYNHQQDSIIRTKRFLDTGDSIIIRDYQSAMIVKKITSQNSFMDLVSSRKPFGFAADITRKNPELFNCEKNTQFNIKFYAWDGVPIVKYMPDKEIDDKHLMRSWKVFISKTADPPIRFGRANKEILRKPFLGEPDTACSETYLTIGCFNSEYEANSVLKYIKTKVCRFLVLQKKKTQNVSKGVFEFVPLQDFTDNSDINWSQSIADIDKQLYVKYDLTQEEIDYIETNVQEMK